MSITRNGIKLKKAKNRRRIFLSLLAFVEILLTVFLYISFAAHTIWPEKAQGTAGVAKVLSYEGRLTDTNGNPVGGTGTNYCFRFSIYNASTAGTKLWPTGTAATTTLMVKDGVFDALIGSADTLDYNFYNSDTVYLDVAVNTASTTCATGGGGTWESLSPRQRIAATGYAITAANVYSDLLRTDIASSTVQIGTGVGSPTIKLLLDTKNSTDSVGAACSPSGTMWYNSADGKNRILVCENQIITPISNATTTIAGIATNAAAAISSGTVVFSNANGVTFGQNANTITASVNAGGGGFAIKDFALLDRAYMLAITNMTAISQKPIFVPFVLPGSLTWNRGDIEVSRATNGSNLFTADFGIYSYVNSTQISLMGSLRNTYSGTNTGNQSGIRRILFTSMGIGATALTPGAYIMGMKFSASAGTASMNYSLRGATLGPPVGNVFPGANSYATATSQLSSMPIARFLGRYTTTSANLPDTVGFNQVQHWTSMYRVYFHLEST